MRVPPPPPIAGMRAAQVIARPEKCAARGMRYNEIRDEAAPRRHDTRAIYENVRRLRTWLPLPLYAPSDIHHTRAKKIMPSSDIAPLKIYTDHRSDGDDDARYTIFRIRGDRTCQHFTQRCDTRAAKEIISIYARPWFFCFEAYRQT